MGKTRSTGPEADTVRIAERSMPPHVRVDPSLPPSQQTDADPDRYQLRDVIGEGGMGEVRVCRDRRIGREVAIKLIRDFAADRSDAVARFEREARVQGQLEHPSVVPVYDLGVDASGRSYFTMKRLRGRTLADVLEKLRANSPDVAQEFSTRKLLAAFSQLCLAVAFAHSRGVLHRDLKPENVMFGDFGEVHLLDWGIATVVEDLRATGQEGRRSVVDAEIDADHKTLVGEMVGTPGYMSPEQIEGDPGKIDERADVFGLGAVLFELLTLEPLVPGKTITEVMSATLSGVEARPSLRTPSRDVAPELERVVVRATGPLAERYPGARELQQEIEKFLDGDRDLEKRRALAADRVAQVEEHTKDAASDSERAEALRELAAAVALDPTNLRAQALLGTLLISGPRELPEEARAVLERERMQRRVALRRANVPASFAFALAPLPLLAMGIKDWTYFWVILAADLLVPAAAIYTYLRRTDVMSSLLLVFASMLAASTGTFILGPVVLVPSNVLAIAIMHSALSRRAIRPLAIPLGAAAILVPLGLQLAGVLPTSYVFEGGVMKIMPIACELPVVGTLLYITIINVLTLVTTTVLVMRQQRLLDRLEERLFLQAWSLKHMLPGGASSTIVGT